MMQGNEKVVLHEEEIGRALTRIAHELLERNPRDPVPALVGIHRRGAFLAQRLHVLLEELLDADVPLGDLDIGFYPDDTDPPPRPAGLPHRLRPPRPHRRDRRRRPLHRSHRPRRDRGAVRLRSPRARAAGRARRPRPPRAADSPRVRGQDPAHLALRARPRATARARRRRRGGHLHGRAGTDHGGLRMNHLLSIEDLDREAIERIIAQAERFSEVSDREIKKVPALRGRMVLNLFYEASTRTRSSFELAAKRLSADVVNFAASGSSVEKGESLKDTVLTLSAHKPDAIVLRTPCARPETGR